MTEDGINHSEREPTTQDEERLRALLETGAGDGTGDGLSTLFAVRRRIRRRWTWRGTVACALAAGLVGGLLTFPPGSHPNRPSTVASGSSGGTFRLTGALTSFEGCAAYLDYVRSTALTLVGPYGLQPYGSYSNNGVFGPVAGGPAGTSSSAGASVPAGAGAGALAPTIHYSAQPAGSYSQTDDQVAGVDEPDTVKTNGQMVVTLAGSTLRVLDRSAHVVGSVAVPGDTSGGFVLDGDQAVVFSATSAAGDGPVGVAQPVYSGATAGVPSATSPSAQVSVVDLSDPSRPQLLHSFLFDGQLVAARLTGGQIRLVVATDGPRLDFVNPSSAGGTAAATTANRDLITGSTLADWLPTWQLEQPDGQTSARTPISSCSAVARPQQASGISTISVLSLDPNASAPGPAASVVAAGNTVLATADQIYLAGAVGSTADPYAGAVPSGCCSVVPPRSATTRIYAFTIPSAGTPVFEGAGSVPGWLVNSYAMDQSAGGLLRVASTSQGSGGTTQSQITVLAAAGGALTAVGSVAGIGRGEFIRAVRFIGDQAYVVTFQTFDPLYVVDLSNPRAPKLAGQLDQPGFSEFLYPLPANRLLGIGVQITSGEPSGLVVATYDVADPYLPRQIDSAVLASGYQYVAQGYDPHAFLYWQPASLALVGIPDQASTGVSLAPGAISPSEGGVAAYQIGADGHLTRTATLAQPGQLTTRSVVLGSQVWGVTNGGVITANLTNLTSTTWNPY